MTTTTRRAHAPAWVLAFLAAVLAVVLGTFTAAPAPAATTSTAQNAVGASNTAAQVSVETSAGITAGQRLGNDPPQPRTVVATGVAANTARSLPTPAEAADLLRAARPTGSALKSDAAHRAGDWVIDDVAQSGSVFELVGGDGVSRTLVQMPGEMNGVAGRFEWIMEGQDLTHQLFVRGGTINGIPIKP